MGRLRDEGFDARVVRDGKGSPAAWLHAGHDPQEPMSIVVPEGDVRAAREALDLPDDPLFERHEGARSRTGTVLVGRFLVWLVIFVLLSALIRGPLSDVLPFLEP